MVLRGVQREQIETDSSFFRAVAKFFNVKSKSEKEKLGFNVPLASCQEASEAIILFENTENTFDLNGTVSPQKNTLVTRQSFQYLGTVLVQHLIDTNRPAALL